MFLGVWIGKLSTGAVLLAALGALSVAEFLMGGSSRRKSLQLFLGALAVATAERALSWILGGVDSGASFMRLEWISQAAFGFPGTLGGLTALGGALFVSLNIFALSILAAVLVFRARESERNFTTNLLVVVLLVAFLSPFFLGGNSLAIFYYLRNPGLVAGMLLLLTALFGDARKSALPVVDFSQNLVFMSLFAGFVWIGFRLSMAEVGTRLSMSLQPVEDAYWIPAAFALVCGLVSPRTRQKVTSAVAASALITCAFLSPIHKTLSDLINERLRPILTNEHISTELTHVPDDLQLITDYLVSSSEGNDIVASNVFCPFIDDGSAQECDDPNWWMNDQLIRSKSGQFENLCSTPESRREFFINYWLPALSGRRFLIQGPDYVAWCTENVDWLNRRISDSENFARRGEADACMELVGQGAKWFVRDLRVPHNGALSGTVFKTENFELVRLSRENCSA